MAGKILFDGYKADQFKRGAVATAKDVKMLLDQIDRLTERLSDTENELELKNEELLASQKDCFEQGLGDLYGIAVSVWGSTQPRCRPE